MRAIASSVATILAAGAMAIGPAAGQGQCPDAGSAARGYMLESRGAKIDVLPFNGDWVQYILTSPTNAHPPEAITSWKGVLPLVARVGNTQYDDVVDGDYRGLLPLRPGAMLEWNVTAKEPGKPDRRAKAVVRVGSGATRISVGSCSYEVWPIYRSQTFEDGVRTDIVMHYAPDLAFWLGLQYSRATPGKGIVHDSVIFERIVGK